MSLHRGDDKRPLSERAPSRHKAYEFILAEAAAGRGFPSFEALRVHMGFGLTSSAHVVVFDLWKKDKLLIRSTDLPVGYELAPSFLYCPVCNTREPLAEPQVPIRGPFMFTKCQCGQHRAMVRPDGTFANKPGEVVKAGVSR